MMNTNKIFNMLAKSNGESLLSHLNKVGELAMYILFKSVGENKYHSEDIDMEKIVKYSSVLHDIGKATSHFQSFLKKNKEENTTKKIPFLHNEIGWAFARKYLNVPNKELKYIADAIYWHHGIINRLEGARDEEIIELLDDDDVLNMQAIAREILGFESIFDEPRDTQTKSPLFYSSDEVEINKHNTLIRACLVSADRIASEHQNKSIDELKNFVDSYGSRVNYLNFENFPYSDKSRFELQKQIALEDCGKTTIPKAPAGFGKTLLGLLWATKSKKKILWVCPRNSIADSVFKSISKELDVFDIDASVELYLTGDVVEVKNSKGGEPFSSDIIVTNIDSFLSPTVDVRHASRMFLINYADVVFDEFHELIGEEALFSAFVNIMSLRHNYLDSRTLLLSATPIYMNFLWDSQANKTIVLPNNEHHYPAAHNKSYEINVSQEIPKKLESSNNIFIFNSISSAQKYRGQKNLSANLIHSEFEAEIKIKKFNDLYQEYGKLSEREKTKSDWVGTHIIQAGWDISFRSLYESVLSPESTMQRIGRIDRWGDYMDASRINVFMGSDKSETSVRNVLYTRNLTGAWFDFLQQYNGLKLTLGEFYELYNKFSIDNRKAIKSYVNNQHNTSLDKLSKIYPIKFLGKQNKTDVKTAGSNKLRSSGVELFYIVKKYQSEKYVGPFSKKVFSTIDEEFHEDGSTRGRILAAMKTLRNENDERFDFNDLLDNKDKVTIDSLRRSARKSNTPYVRFDKVYHDEYGIVSEEILENIKNSKTI